MAEAPVRARDKFDDSALATDGGEDGSSVDLAPDEVPAEIFTAARDAAGATMIEHMLMSPRLP
ncbi:MAG: hypothetical protein QM638_17695 [Nocardioides sp.]|uniref:hypothetical protein n=1 Tax=Nocardioides sp. TaxID=35761 RepID=UPI0039E300CE